jgi:hypothetical protein
MIDEVATRQSGVIDMSDGNDTLDRVIQTRSGLWGLVLFLLGGLVFVGAVGGLIMTTWEATLGYTLGFIGMCIGFVGVVIMAVVASRLTEAS